MEESIAQQNGEIGGQSPHIAARRGSPPLAGADLGALPDEYRRELLDATERQAERFRGAWPRLGQSK